MGSYQRLQGVFDVYNQKVTAARNERQMSLTDLADAAGISFSAVATQSAGRADNPRLFEQAAIADVLGLSLDELCGLAEPRDVAQLTERIHELELLNARKEGVIAELTAKYEGEQRRCEDYEQRLAAQHINGLPQLALLAMMLVAVIYYVVWDVQIDTAGLFASTGLSILAVLLGVIVLAAIVVIVRGVAAAVHDFRAQGRDKK